MVRVKRGIVLRRRHKRLLKFAKGYYGARSRLFKTAKITVDRALSFAYRDRRVRKRVFRKLWISRINSSVREKYGLTYSVFISQLRIAKVLLSRKTLSELAFNDNKGFLSMMVAIKEWNERAPLFIE